MAFPVVQTTNESATTTAGTSHIVNLPTGITAGELLVVLMAIGSTAATVNVLAGWSEVLDASQANDLKVLVRQADGSEGATVTFTTSAATRDASISYRISGALPLAIRAPEISAVATGSSTTPNPGTVTPTGGTKDYLWLAAFTRDGEALDDDAWCSAAPAGYTNLLRKACGTAGTNLGGLIASAQLGSAVSTQDPGTFTASTGAWRAYTIAVHSATRDLVGTSDAIGEHVAGAAVARALASWPTVAVDISDAGGDRHPAHRHFRRRQYRDAARRRVGSDGRRGRRRRAGWRSHGVRCRRCSRPLGASEAVAEAVASLGRDRGVAGAVEGVAELAGVLGRDRGVIGASEAVAEDVALLARDRGVVGASEAIGEAVAALSTSPGYAGAVEGVAEFVGDVGIGGQVVYLGAVEAVAEHVASLDRAAPIVGASEAVAETVAALYRDRPVAGAVEGVAEHVADLTVSGPAGTLRDLAGAVEGVAELAGALDASRAVSGAAEAVAELAGVVIRDRGLVGAHEAVAEAVALLARDRGVAGAVEGWPRMPALCC